MSVVDLTYSIHAGMFKYPSDPDVYVEMERARFECDKEVAFDESSYSFAANIVNGKYKSGHVVLHLRNHHGTHIDAPAHKISGGKTIDKYGIEKFLNKSCALIDLTSGDLLERGKREITRGDIEDMFEYVGFRVNALIFYTGFSDEILRMEGKLKGDEKRKFESGFPYFSEEAARYVVEKNRDLGILGIDSFTVDPSGSNSEAHRVFFSKDVLPLETLVNVGALMKAIGGRKNYIFRLNCVPLLYGEADAAQVRAFAEINNYSERPK